MHSPVVSLICCVLADIGIMESQNGTVDSPVMPSPVDPSVHSQNLRPDVLEELMNLADDLGNIQLQPYSDQLVAGE